MPVYTERPTVAEQKQWTTVIQPQMTQAVQYLPQEQLARAVRAGSNIAQTELQRRNTYVPPVIPPTIYPTTSWNYPATSTGGTLGQWSAKNAPPVPYWLPQVSPGQVAGAKTQKLPVKIPSGQLWSQFMPSWRAGLESYINYAAGTAGVIASYQDLVAQILGMQPGRSPYRAGQWNTGGIW